MPLILALGSEESEQFHRQQADYLAAWQGAGLAAEVVELGGRNHFTAVDALGEGGHPLFAAVKAQVLSSA